MTEIPKTLDWVKARFDCSLPSVFLALEEAAKSDVASITPRVTAATFSVERVTDQKFMVSKAWTAGGIQQGDAIVFELLPSRGIQVTRSHAQRPLFFAKPALQPDGACKLEIDGDTNAAPLELWQVSRRALEDLFFS